MIDHSRRTYALHESKVEEILRDALQVEVTSPRSVPSTKLVDETKASPNTSIEQPEEKPRSKFDLQSEAQHFVEREVEKEKQRELRTSTILVVNQAFHNRLYFVSKNEFVSQLDLLLAQKSQPHEIRAKGYRVKLNYTSSQDPLAQQKALKDVMLSSLRRKDKMED